MFMAFCGLSRYFGRRSEAVDTSEGLGDLEAKAHYYNSLTALVLFLITRLKSLSAFAGCLCSCSVFLFLD